MEDAGDRASVVGRLRVSFVSDELIGCRRRGSLAASRAGQVAATGSHDQAYLGAQHGG